MKAVEAMSVAVTQAEFAVLIGVSEAKVSQLVAEGVIERGHAAHAWLLAYCERLREVAAGRASGDAGGLDLVQERAALAREQRVAQAIKNAAARGELADVEVLADVLGRASSAVVDRFDQLEGVLRKAVPDLSDEAKRAVLSVIASARNEWVRSTERLVSDYVDQLLQEDGFDEDNQMGLESEAEATA